MKNMKKNNIDSITEIKNYSKFKRFSEEAEVRIKLAIEIYEARKLKRLSQQELARMAETTQKVISRIESGDVNVGIDLLQRIAKNLNFTIKNWANIFNKNKNEFQQVDYTIKNIADNFLWVNQFPSKEEKIKTENSSSSMAESREAILQLNYKINI